MGSIAVKCRFCKSLTGQIFVDLGMSPLANSYLKPQGLQLMEPFYPLRVYVCEHCFLVQIDEFENPQNIFQDYAYFSSYSTSWLRHAEDYVKMVISRFNITSQKQVIEIGSNDGYLLQYFKKAHIPVLGIEPAANVAEAAKDKGILTLNMFFNRYNAIKMAAQGQKADLLIGNNVLAHVPDILDFAAGLKMILNSRGIITMEFPHLLRLIEENQFDTIYHEHFSYFSLTVVKKIFKTLGLIIFDVEEIPTHGGSLRIYVGHVEDDSKVISNRVNKLLEKESLVGLNKLETYWSFEKRVTATKYAVLEFLIKAKRKGEIIVGYGAPAKGNTLLNYCGIRTDFIDYTVDNNPHKQGLYLPGTHIPIYHPDSIKKTKPDYLFVLPWNLKEEIIEQMSYVRKWGCRFVIPVPKLQVL